MVLAAAHPVSSLFFVRFRRPSGFPKRQMVQPHQPGIIVVVQEAVGPTLQAEVSGVVKDAKAVRVTPLDLKFPNEDASGLWTVVAPFAGVPKFAQPASRIATKRCRIVPVVTVTTGEGPPSHGEGGVCFHLRLARRSSLGVPSAGRSMGRVVVHLHGRPKERSMADAIGVYASRLTPRGVRIEIHAARTTVEAYLASVPPAARMVLLDERGFQHDSASFAEQINAWQLASEDVHLMVGPSDGWQGHGEGADRISLSPMTMPHELAAVVLVEQVYRATEILRGSAYHRA
jgi:23S rRNA (pseudouridine1915-N3)-methyltransferase